MLEKIIDLHIHSKYSRACSKELELPKIAAACVKKGIDILSTGDFTHPKWLEHIEEVLEEENSGVYILKKEFFPETKKIKFILGSEIACIYKHKDKVRRLHILLFAPHILAVKKLNTILEERGINIRSDGRPIMGLSAKELLQIALSVDPAFVMIPAHAWTPWFAVFGSKSGYDSLEECFEELTPHIRAIETGLSSDPTMNRRLTQLDNITMISNSDAHGLENLGREANVLAFEDEKDITFSEIMRTIQEGDRKKFLYTIEFYPEEGKYHNDGHANCKVSLEPEESKREKDICPICKKKLTIGVLHRVDDLADREVKTIPENRFIPHKYIVPLREIIGQVFEVGVASKRVKAEYDRLITSIGSEFYILLHASIEDILKQVSDPLIAKAIENMRNGKVRVTPGYDGIFGVIEAVGDSKNGKPRQTSLF
jgi:uncharacterized protein (TIGR00375 family)